LLFFSSLEKEQRTYGLVRYQRPRLPHKPRGGPQPSQKHGNCLIILGARMKNEAMPSLKTPMILDITAYIVEGLKCYRPGCLYPCPNPGFPQDLALTIGGVVQACNLCWREYCSNSGTWRILVLGSLNLEQRIFSGRFYKQKENGEYIALQINILMCMFR